MVLVLALVVSACSTPTAENPGDQVAGEAPPPTTGSHPTSTSSEDRLPDPGHPLDGTLVDEDALEPHGTAFPGCEGWGCETEGGRGGEVYVVTSTADSGPGTLREALEASGPRYIITQVDGVVDLDTPIIVTSGSVTLDLRRPPGEGLTITGQAIVFRSVTDVVVLGVRYRGTDSLARHTGQNASDCINLTSVQKAVVARSSFFGCVDEGVSIERSARDSFINADITIQENLFWEQCMIDCQEGRGHARPINLSRGWDRVAIHHNLMVGNQRRQPQVAGCVGHPECTDVDHWPDNPTAFVGYNLIGYWSEQATHVKNGARADIVGNVYIPGPESSGPAVEITDTEPTGSLIHVTGNLECGSLGSSDCVEAMVDPSLGAVSSTRLSGMSVTPTDAGILNTEAWIRSLGPSVWDVEDERALDELLAGTIVVGGSFDPNTYIPPEPASGVIEDGDRDGIPDGVDPRPDVFSAWDDTNEDGWTDLEAYLAGLDVD